MYCPKCGKENPEGARFCMHCGADLSEYKVEISPNIVVSPKIETKFDILKEKVVCKSVTLPQCFICGRKALTKCSECGEEVCHFHSGECYYVLKDIIPLDNIDDFEKDNRHHDFVSMRASGIFIYKEVKNVCTICAIRGYTATVNRMHSLYLPYFRSKEENTLRKSLPFFSCEDLRSHLVEIYTDDFEKEIRNLEKERDKLKNKLPSDMRYI